MASDKDIKRYAEYMKAKTDQERHRLNRAKKRLEQFKELHKVNSLGIEDLEKLGTPGKRQRLDEIFIEGLKISKKEYKTMIIKDYESIKTLEQCILIGLLKEHYLSEKDIYYFDYYIVNEREKERKPGKIEEFRAKFPEFIEAFREVMEEKEVKQCFTCGGIEPINEYQKNGKTPRGTQKHRQECRECREERKEREREAREKVEKEAKEHQEARERAAEKERQRKKEPKKVCKVCGKKKPISEYQKNGKTPGGTQKYRQECLKCRNKHLENEKALNIKAEEMNRGTKILEEHTEKLKEIIGYKVQKKGKK